MSEDQESKDRWKEREAMLRMKEILMKRITYLINEAAKKRNNESSSPSDELKSLDKLASIVHHRVWINEIRNKK